MPKPVIMPKLGFTQDTSQIVRWIKQPGEAVEQGDPIAEVTTDKVNMEVEAPATGILDGPRYREGDTVPVTEIIAYIRQPNEPPVTTPSPDDTPPAGEKMTEPGMGPAPAVPPSQTPANGPSSTETGGNRITPVAANLAQERGVDPRQVRGTGPCGRVTKRDVEMHLAAQDLAEQPGKVRASPSARRVARTRGVDLSEVEGSGPRGRIQSPDVLQQETRRVEAPSVPMPEPRQPVVPPPAPRVTPPPTTANVYKTIPLTGMRLTIATRLQKSAQEIPHITFDADVDVTAAEDLRARANALLSEGRPRISLTAVLTRATAAALKLNPMVNSRLEGQQILLLKDINIGIAVALEEGLIVPVVHGVDHKGLGEIAAEIAELVDRSRNGRLRAEDLSDGTFSISNLGMFGVDRFTAIINSPQSAILAVGRVAHRFVPDEQGNPVVRPLMTLTLSADHRIVDGVAAARFLGDLKNILEHPELLVM